MITFDSPLSRLTKTGPLYAQIAEGVLDRIESGDLSPGDRIPSERKLSRMLGVNRLTVRRALEMLASQGLLSRRQGDGTYVTELKIERQAGRLVPFTRGMERRGYLPQAQVVSLDKRPAGVAVAGQLRLSVSAAVYRLHRLWSINQEPVMLEELLVPAQRFPGFDGFDLCQRSVYDVFEAEYGVVVVRARQSLEPVVATEYEAELLGVKAGFPLMLERRLGFDQNDEPVDSGKDLYRGDRFRFVTEFARLAS